MTFEIFKRFLFYVTKPVYASKPKLPKTIPSTGEMKEFKIINKGGYSFMEYKREKIDFNDEKRKLPPLLSSRNIILNKKKIEEMRELKRSNPKKWTINVLVKKYNVGASFIINHVFSHEERTKLKDNVDNYIRNLSIKKQKGLVKRELVKRHRNEY